MNFGERPVPVGYLTAVFLVVQEMVNGFDVVEAIHCHKIRAVCFFDNHGGAILNAARFACLRTGEHEVGGVGRWADRCGHHPGEVIDGVCNGCDIPSSTVGATLAVALIGLTSVPDGVPAKGGHPQGVPLLRRHDCEFVQ